MGWALGQTAEAIDQSLFADLKSEQKLVSFEDISAKRLLERYNVALAQAILIRSSRVQVKLQGISPARCRQLCRRVKFHRLVCEIETRGGGDLTLRLDGPLSLFSATQKYGLQLAFFLPAILACPSFELTAEVRWGVQRKEKTFVLTQSDGLVASGPDPGQYVPPELALFVDLFRKKITDWNLAEEGEIFRLGNHFWVPDFRLTERASGRIVYLERSGILAACSSLEIYLELLRAMPQYHLFSPSRISYTSRKPTSKASRLDLTAFSRICPCRMKSSAWLAKSWRPFPCEEIGAAPDVA